jgi:hypothetical protein
MGICWMSFSQITRELHPNQNRGSRGTRSTGISDEIVARFP